MKQRLDRLLVEQKLAPSREKAQALVMAGKVRVYGQPAGKSGHVIDVDSHLEVLGDDQPFVSRGGVKLQAALEYFKSILQDWLLWTLGLRLADFHIV